MDIARMYVSLNMHTRAIELLHEFDDVIGPEAASLREQYLAGWLKLVRGLSRLTPPRTIYNQSIATPEDQAKVTVPPPLSAEALANAARIMEKIEAGHY